jgi:transketolase
MRKDLGEALRAYGAVNPDVVVLDADVSSSMMTRLFREAYPERFFSVGIAEAGMVDTAVGLALGGKIPFVSAFAAMLCYRALEQIRTCVAYNRANVKLLAGYAGVSDYKDGPTHHSVFDLAVMRAMPNMTVVTAADGPELRALIPAVAEHEGPVYLRISRADVPQTFGPGDTLQIGKGRTVREGKEVAILVTGVPLYRALAARELLAAEGISARVVELHTLKPLDVELVRACAAETGALVTVEEHSVIGGLYGAVAETLAAGGWVPVEAVGIRDTYCCTGPDPETLWDHVGLRPQDIAAAARRALARAARARPSDP